MSARPCTPETGSRIGPETSGQYKAPNAAIAARAMAKIILELTFI